MMNFIMVPTICGIFVYGIYKLFELFVRRRERILIIEKMSEIDLKGDIQMGKLFNTPIAFGALKAGCLLMGIGIGMIFAFMIAALTIKAFPNDFNRDIWWEYSQILSIIFGASVLMFGGIGLVISFIIGQKINASQKK